MQVEIWISVVRGWLSTFLLQPHHSLPPLRLIIVLLHLPLHTIFCYTCPCAILGRLSDYQTWKSRAAGAAQTSSTSSNQCRTILLILVVLVKTHRSWKWSVIVRLSIRWRAQYGYESMQWGQNYTLLEQKGTVFDIFIKIGLFFDQMYIVVNLIFLSTIDKNIKNHSFLFQ